MSKIKIAGALFISLVAALGAAVGPSHDLVLCVTFRVPGGLTATALPVPLPPCGLHQRGTDNRFTHFGPNYPRFNNLARDPRDPRVLYAASLNGVLCSTDGGEVWRIGTSWDMTEPRDVCIDPHAPDHIYLALPDGIAVSKDRGLTWPRRETGLPDRGKYMQVVKVDRTQAGRVLAGCESGIYLTETAAQSWRRVFTTQTTITDLQQSPHDAQLWLATTQSDGALRSRDGGRTWEKIAGVPAAAALYNIAFDATNARRYAVASWTYGILTTEDGGETWSERNVGLPVPHRVFRLGIDPDNGRLYAGVYEEAVYESLDFGRTWRSAGFEHSVVYNFVFLPRFVNLPALAHLP